MVVVSIDIKEKSEIWSTRETRNPAPVLAIDSTRDIERVWLVIGSQVRCVKDRTRVIMPPSVLAFRAHPGERGHLLWDDAVVRVVEGLEAGVPSD